MLSENGVKGLAYVSLIAVVIVGLVVGLGVYYLTIPGEEEPEEPEEKLVIGYAMHFLGGEGHRMRMQYAKWLAEDCGIELICTNANNDVGTQYEQIKWLIEKGIDGIVWVPVDLEGSVRTAELLYEHGIPNTTFDGDVNSPYNDFYVTVDIYDEDMKLWDMVAGYLTEKYGEPRGLVFNIEGSRTVFCGQEDYRAMCDAMEKYPDMDVKSVIVDWDPGKAKEVTYELILKWGKPDVLFGQDWCALALGGMEALDMAGMLVSNFDDPEEHIPVFTGDSEYEFLQAIIEGYADVSGYRCTPSYSTGALSYLVRIIREGKENVLPPVGSVVTLDDWNLDEWAGSPEHFGISVFEGGQGLPASVGEQYGHTYLRLAQPFVGYDDFGTGATLWDPEDSRLWANVLQILKEQGIYF